MGGPLRSVYVGVSTDAKLGLLAFLFTDHKVFTGPAGSANQGALNLFPALATDDFGFVYAVWSDNSKINFSSSGDQGATWTTPVQVNRCPTTGCNANVFPWVTADANGHVVVVWYGANLAGNSNSRMAMENGGTTAGVPCSDGSNKCWAQWHVYAAETVNGHDTVACLSNLCSTAAFTQYTASDHVIHAGTISTGGLGGGANRNLADFFQVALDPMSHFANIAFADDHVLSPLCQTRTTGHCTDRDDAQGYRTGQPYFTRQIKSNLTLVTTGTCASGGGGGGGGAGGEKITGGGQIASQTPGLTANFGFVAQNNKPNASLSYHDDGAAGGTIDVHSANTSVPTVTFSGNCSTFSGDAKVNQKLGYTYSVNACDMGEPGAGKDFFSIAVKDAMGKVVYSDGGKLISGNIQIHQE